jgi:hypothetical protein
MTMRTMFGSAAAALLLAASSPAFACVEPAPPSRFSKPDKPTEPFWPSCAPARSCTDLQVRAYNYEVERYTAEVTAYEDEAAAYVHKLKAYLAEAEEYAMCEAQSLDD